MSAELSLGYSARCKETSLREQPLKAIGEESSICNPRQLDVTKTGFHLSHHFPPYFTHCHEVHEMIRPAAMMSHVACSSWFPCEDQADPELFCPNTKEHPDSTLSQVWHEHPFQSRRQPQRGANARFLQTKPHICHGSAHGVSFDLDPSKPQSSAG